MEILDNALFDGWHCGSWQACGTQLRGDRSHRMEPLLHSRGAVLASGLVG